MIFLMKLLYYIQFAKVLLIFEIYKFKERKI